MSEPTELKPCPFCNSDKAKIIHDCVRVGDWRQKRYQNAYAVQCSDCDARTKRFVFKVFFDFIPYTFSEYLNNSPSQRTQIEEDHDAHIEAVKMQSIEAWNKRSDGGRE